VFGKKLFEIAVWIHEALLEKTILISLLERVFCEIDIITPNTIEK